MRKLFIVLGILAALFFIGVLALPSLIPANAYKAKIEQQISAKLGRNVTIAGDVKLSVFPTISANAETVTIDNQEGFSASPFITMESLQANVKLLPLLRKQVEISKFTLIKPQISLEKLKNGEVNWAFGSENSKKTKITKSDSFSRDGRYSDLQISLGVFTLKDGNVKFNDAQTDKAYTLESANLKVTMLGMDKPVSAKGDLIFNNVPMVLDTRLDTPRSFLKAQETPFFIKMKSNLITLNANGKFTASKNLSFDIDFDTNIPSIAELDKILGIQNPYGALTEKVSMKSALSFDGLNLKASNAVLSLNSEMISTDFKGNFTAGPTPSASGNLAVKISDLYNLQKMLGFNYPQTSAINIVDISTNLSTNGKVTKGSDIVFNIKGDDITASYNGSAVFDNALSLNGNFKANSPSLRSLATNLGMKDIQGSSAIGDISVSGEVNGLIDKLALSNINLTTNSSQLSTSYQGDFKLGRPMAINGHFEIKSPSAQTVMSTFGLDKVPGSAALGKVDVVGEISGSKDAVSIRALKFSTDNNLLKASYQGDISRDETIAMNGKFNVSIPSVKNFSDQSGVTIPNANAFGALKTNGLIEGTTEAFTLTQLNTQLSDGILNLQFEGAAHTGKALNFEGELTTNITSIRDLAALSGKELAASTDQGEIYGPLSLSGHAKGTNENISFTNANLAVDNIKGNGAFQANLRQAKPIITGALDLQGLDIRPYMVAQNPSGKIKPWSEEPLNLNILNLFDADLKLSTPNILVGRMTLGQSNIHTRIKNGVLTTKIPNVSLYGGQGDLDMTVNAQRPPITTVALDFTLKNIDGQGFLGAAAGFTKLTGNTGTTMMFRGSGRTQAEIMRSLSGNGDFELAEGIVSGVDIGQFVSGLDSALRSGALPSGIGSGYTTPFNKIAGLFTVKNGVLTVGDFSLNSDTVSAGGSGTLDIGKQKIDFSLQPKLLNATGIAGFGIPIRFSGNFGGVTAGLDTNLLSNIVAAQAKAQLQSQITNKVGGDLGGLLEGVLGNTPTGSTSSPQPQSPSSEEILGGVLGDLLGGQQPQQTTPLEPSQEQPESKDQKEEEKKDEDPLEKALMDLFGDN